MALEISFELYLYNTLYEKENWDYYVPAIKCALLFICQSALL